MAIRFNTPVTTQAVRGVATQIEIQRASREAEGTVELREADGTVVRTIRVRDVAITIGSDPGEMPPALARALERWFLEAAAVQGKLPAGALEDD